MNIVVKSARFIISSPQAAKCPDYTFPEYAFTGRSNVGKSSLINMLTNQHELAKTSGRPGKTQQINYFLINESWYLVDLPGYGFAKADKQSRGTWEQLVTEYLKKRRTLACTFLLIDSRLSPQKNDLMFIHLLGNNQVPFVIVFTKTDKLSASTLHLNVTAFQNELLKTWETLPVCFLTSSKTKKGRDEILKFIGDTNNKIEGI